MLQQSACLQTSKSVRMLLTSQEMASDYAHIWIWTVAKERAAIELAKDDLRDDVIARNSNVSPRSLARWKTVPQFIERIEQHKVRLREEVLKHGIADKVERVRAQNDRWMRMKRVVQERAESLEMQDVAGGKTGLLVRQVKSIGYGEDAQLVDEYAVDTGLLKAIAEVEKQAAQELGQLITKSELSGPDGGAIPLTLDILDGVGSNSEADTTAD